MFYPQPLFLTTEKNKFIHTLSIKTYICNVVLKYNNASIMHLSTKRAENT